MLDPMFMSINNVSSIRKDDQLNVNHLIMLTVYSYNATAVFIFSNINMAEIFI